MKNLDFIILTLLVSGAFVFFSIGLLASIRSGNRADQSTPVD